MAVGARILIDLSPVLFATALGRVLTGLGYEVDLGRPVNGHEMALVSEGNGGDAPIVIELRLDKTTATVFSGGESRRVPVGGLRDLLEVVERELPRKRLALEG
jgi:hypothetical protein